MHLYHLYVLFKPRSRQNVAENQKQQASSQSPLNASGLRAVKDALAEWRRRMRLLFPAEMPPEGRHSLGAEENLRHHVQHTGIVPASDFETSLGALDQPERLLFVRIWVLELFLTHLALAFGDLYIDV